MHTGAIKEGQRVLLIDDLIATGGTLAAGVKLIEQVVIFILERSHFHSHTDLAISHNSIKSMLPVYVLSFLAGRLDLSGLESSQYRHLKVSSLGSFCTCQYG